MKRRLKDVYFQKLNCDLQMLGRGVPSLIVDGEQLELNLNYVQQQLSLANHLKPRLVVKSLACLKLLQKISLDLNTQRFMVFHLPQLLPILENFSSADILLGKPMPVSAVAYFYKNHREWKTANIQWLVDTPKRLQEYLGIARKYEIQMKINIEIDVGLHRGGVVTDQELVTILQWIESNPNHLKFSGLMGYDAHITKLPSFLKKADVAFDESQQIYRHFLEMIQYQFPDFWNTELCFNGGGSPSFSFHVKQSVCNDLSFGSMLLKPTDFDSIYLQDLQPALWIASPVLKVLQETDLPGIPLFKKLPQTSKALFIYGGYWMADYVYPEGSHPHLLYGRSSNQELVNVPRSTQIGVNDHVFIRPTQSEAIIPQFSKLYFYSKSHFEEWETFRE